jgi:hypothetical protein
VTTITNANITDRRRSVFVAPTGARNQGLINGKIVPTVASNNLTVAIKTLTDTDPTATNPVGIWIGNQLRWITSAMNTTMPVGFNAFNAASNELKDKEIDYFVYIGRATTGGALSVGFARIPYARLGADLSSSVTNEKYARFDSANILPSDITEVVNIGRFAATLSTATNWSVPTFSNANLIQEPIYETRWLDWTPAYTAGTMTYTSVTLAIAKYQIQNRNINFTFRTSDGTTGGTATGLINVSLPFNLNGCNVRNAVYVFDGSGNRIGWGDFDNTSLVIMRKIDTTNFGLGSSKEIGFNDTIRIP